MLEKGNQPGGRAYTYEEKGFTLNYGPHAMYRPDTGVLGERHGAGSAAPSRSATTPTPITSYWADGDRFASDRREAAPAARHEALLARRRSPSPASCLKLEGEKPDRLAET